MADKKLVTKYAIIASLISGAGLTLVYLSLFKLGVGIITIPNTNAPKVSIVR
jgi:branched-subunit amino acid permease